MAVEYETEVRVVRIYVPAPNGDGTIPVTQRTLFLTRLTETWSKSEPTRIKIFQVRRHGEVYYSVTCVPMIAQNIWLNPTGRPDVWYKEQEEYTEGVDQDGQTVYRLKWTKYLDHMTANEMVKWLEGRLGKDRTDELMVEFLLSSAPAEKVEKVTTQDRVMMMSDEEFARVVALRKNRKV